jgi:hypothetical protein
VRRRIEMRVGIAVSGVCEGPRSSICDASFLLKMKGFYTALVYENSRRHVISTAFFFACAQDEKYLNVNVM